MSCDHTHTHCLNQHDLIRKYRCDACGGVMMCTCDEVFGHRFLSHQLSDGTELETQNRVPVDLGFQPKICPECRGLPAEPAPAGEIHGRTSKIKRYYWRELFFETTRRCADWDEAHLHASPDEQRAAHAEIERTVLKEIKALHATNPKYVSSEPSQAEILERYGVEVIALKADYAPDPKKGAAIRDGDEIVSPETFVTRRYEAEGWSVMSLESTPFHALFGVMMWMLIQDPADPKCRMAGFGDRTAYEAGEKPPMIWCLHPEDFGSSAYGVRRQQAIARHLEKLPKDRDALLWTFDYWRSYSSDLRQYLWAHREEDVDRARRLIKILSPDQILRVLHLLADHYWAHYLGWPDLLLHRQGEVLMLEVKSSSDKLSQDQKDWIASNHDRLNLPFKIVKLHRSSTKPKPNADRSILQCAKLFVVHSVR